MDRGQRWQSPALGPFFLSPVIERDTTFSSGIDEDAYSRLTIILNKYFNKPDPLPVRKFGKTFERDVRKGDIRYTFNEETGKFMHAMRKIRVRNSHCVFPCTHPYDIRFSVSTEVPVECATSAIEAISVEEKAMGRKKERRSYIFEWFRIDLTKVTVSTQPKPSWEVEVELQKLEKLKSLQQEHPNNPAYSKIMADFYGVLVVIESWIGTIP